MIMKEKEEKAENYQNLLLFIHIAAINCSSLPTFVNGIHHGKGCHAAVWRDGSPSKQYCVNDDKFPWWRQCCKWIAGECVPKWHPTSSNATSSSNISLKPGIEVTLRICYW